MNILVSVLNWGLGHATRCVPIIRALNSLGHRVTIASDGGALDLLCLEFPELTATELPSYNIHYGKGMSWSMIRQSAKIIRTRSAEHQAVQKMVSEHNVDLIISDQRYGCYHRHIKSVFITHQVHLPLSGMQKAAGQRIHNTWLKNFNEIWVPDTDLEPRLAGKMSLPHPSITSRYLGIISRFNSEEASSHNETRTIDLLAVLSGPEPRRTDLEKVLLDKFTQSDTRNVLVRGITDGRVNTTIQSHGSTIIYNFCKGQYLKNLLASAHQIITRSGFTSLMDLCALKKPALLIPTQGQPEQEYLAQYAHEHNWARKVQFDNIKRLSKLDSYYSPWPEVISQAALTEKIAQWL